MNAKPAAILAGTLLAAACAGGAGTAPTLGPLRAAQALAPSLTGLRVSGNELVDGNDNVVRLQGVNRSGTEYACVQGWGIFDGPNDAASIEAIAHGTSTSCAFSSTRTVGSISTA